MDICDKCCRDCKEVFYQGQWWQSICGNSHAEFDSCQTCVSRKPRRVYYYQTFCGLQQLLQHPEWVSHVNLAAIHFGSNQSGEPYIHLNDHPPDDPVFDTVWSELGQLQRLGVTVILTVGGAGGAFTYMSQHFDPCYDLLADTVRRHGLQGVDLDIEEGFSLDMTRELIRRLKRDFGSGFVITMAPLISSLQTDQPGMSGFSYRELTETPEGQAVDWFNAQSYYSYTPADYTSAVKNGYHPSKVVFGMISSQFSADNFNRALDTLASLSRTYSDFGGCYVWEYFNAPPDRESDPAKWAELINKKMLAF